MTKSKRTITPRLVGALIVSISILLLAAAPAFASSKKTTQPLNPTAIAAHLRILQANAGDVAADEVDEVENEIDTEEAELDQDDQGDEAEDDQGDNDQSDEVENDQGE